MVPRNCPYSALSRPFRALSRPFGESGHGIMTKLRSRLTRRQGVNLSHRNRGFDGWFMSIYVQFGWMILRCRVDQDEFYWVLVRVHAWWYMIHDDTWYMFIYVLAMFSYRIDGSVEMFRQSFTCQVYLEKITVWGAVKVLHTSWFVGGDYAWTGPTLLYSSSEHTVTYLVPQTLKLKDHSKIFQELSPEIASYQ